MEISAPIPFIGSPPLAFRFGVLFFIGGTVPNPIDIMFQKVSGFNTTIDTETVAEGGQNLYSQLLPKQIKHNNLVLERGLVVGSPLVIEFNIAMSRFKFSSSNVLVSLLDSTSIPVASWLFFNAYPVKWSITDLDAAANSVVIETMELAYQHRQTIRI